jgi:hypothetical protein
MKKVIVALIVLLVLSVGWIFFMIVRIIIEPREELVGLSDSEILQGIYSRGPSFCKRVELDLREECMNMAYRTQAETKGNPEACNKLTEGREDCIREVVYMIVIENHKKGKDDTSLCRHISDEMDREACENPGQLITYCYGGSCYA